jgi:hypothetical protein
MPRRPARKPRRPAPRKDALPAAIPPDWLAAAPPLKALPPPPGDQPPSHQATSPSPPPAEPRQPVTSNQSPGDQPRPSSRRARQPVTSNQSPGHHPLALPAPTSDQPPSHQTTSKRTPEGKRASSRNAITHGITSPNPVIPGEDPDEWRAHLQDWLDDLHPVGKLEEHLVERLAIVTWQQRRLLRYEVESIALARDSAASQAMIAATYGQTLRAWQAELGLDNLRTVLTDLRNLPGFPYESDSVEPERAARMLCAVADDDPKLLAIAVPGLPPREDWDRFEGWTVALLREAIAAVAKNARATPEALLDRAVAAIAAAIDEIDNNAEALRRRALLPEGDRFEKASRYGTSLHRAFNQVLHELEAARISRNGGRAPLARVSFSGPPSG